MADTRHRALITAAKRAWGVDDAATTTFIKERENIVFRIDSPAHGPLALRFHRPSYRSGREVASEIAWLDALGRDGLSVPRVLPATDGSTLVRLHDEGGRTVHASVQHWIEDAEPLGDVAELFAGAPLHPALDAEALGGLAARLHDAAERLPRPAGFTRAPWDRDALVGPRPLWGDPAALTVLGPDDRATLRAVADRIDARLRALPTTPRHYGLIHADLTLENVLVDETGRLTAIDFDDFGEGWYLFDLATILFFATPRADYPALSDAVLAGYSRNRELAGPAWEAWDELLVARGLSYLGWAAGRPETDAARFIESAVAPWVLRAARALLDDAPMPWGPRPTRAERTSA